MKESLDLNFLTNVYDYYGQFFFSQHYHFVHNFGDNSTNSKAANERLPSVLNIELDDVIVGQGIPGVRRWGIDVSDLVAWLGPEED